MTYAIYLLTLPIAEIRKIKRAVNLLNRAGFTYDDACTIVIQKHQERRNLRG